MLTDRPLCIVDGPLVNEPPFKDRQRTFDALCFGLQYITKGCDEKRCTDERGIVLFKKPAHSTLDPRE